MAFAAGQLEHTDRPTGSSVPLSLWYRRGLAVDPSSSLDQLASAMASYFPFDPASAIKMARLIPLAIGMG